MESKSLSQRRVGALAGLYTPTGMVSIIATVILVLAFARLGFWQLARAEEKVEMLEAHEQASNAKPLREIKPGTQVEEIIYRNLELTGSYDYSHQFLLDNRIHNKQAGYEVLTPFYPGNTQGFILVNRGWIGHDGNRAVKPVIPAATKGYENTATGVLASPSKGFVLGPALVQTAETWPLVLQYIDYATIADKVDKIPLLHAVLIAEQGQSGSLVRNWQPVANGPMKHYGYAFQWFSMLAAVLCIFVYFNFVKKK